jgi:hypothetical protein
MTKRRMIGIKNLTGHNNLLVQGKQMDVNLLRAEEQENWSLTETIMIITTIRYQTNFGWTYPLSETFFELRRVCV